MMINPKIHKLRAGLDRRIDAVGDLLNRLYFWPQRKGSANEEAEARVKAFYYTFPTRRQGTKYREQWQSVRSDVVLWAGREGAEHIDAAVERVWNATVELNAAVEAVEAARQVHKTRLESKTHPHYDYPKEPLASSTHWFQGDNILLRYGNGTQVFRVYFATESKVVPGRFRLTGLRLRNRGVRPGTYRDEACWRISCPIWSNDTRILGVAQLCPEDPTPPTLEQYRHL